MALSKASIAMLADSYRVPVLSVQAVMDVEARGAGFLPGEPRLPTILFEGHQFSKFTNGAFDKDHPTISYPKWTKRHYQGGRREYDRLVQALKLDWPAALKATSWGVGQVMGFNYKTCGYPNVDSFVDAMGVSELTQAGAMMAYIEAHGLLRHLRAFPDKKALEAFARGYNGPGYVKNAYDRKLAAAYRKVTWGPKVREVQEKLVEEGWSIAVDGAMGPETKGALIEYQQAAGLEPDGMIGPKTLAHMGIL